jgi:hypothetical protein
VLLMAVFTLAGAQGGDARVVLTAEPKPGGHVVFGLTQGVSAAPLEWVANAGGNETLTVDGGGLTTVAIVAARRIAAACEGRMTVDAGVGGTGIYITLPSFS